MELPPAMSVSLVECFPSNVFNLKKIPNNAFDQRTRPVGPKTFYITGF